MNVRDRGMGLGCLSPGLGRRGVEWASTGGLSGWLVMGRVGFGWMGGRDGEVVEWSFSDGVGISSLIISGAYIRYG